MGNYKLPGGGLGTATPDKVLEGSTFTSNKGVNQVGTMPDVSAEVTAQTPIIKSILDNLKLTETPVSGTLKQKLQGNNTNLSKIKTKLYRVPVSLQVTPPIKTNYQKGETLDLAGMKVMCTYNNGVIEDVTSQCEVTPMVLNTSGTQAITVTYTENNKIVTATFNVNVKVKIVTWAGGTDAEIVDMVEASDKGLINLSDYWTVGDERQIRLSAMEASGVSESHAEQTVTMVLMHQGGVTLANGKPCAFVVGQKDCLNEIGYMNSDDTNTSSWDGSQRRAWCNSVYYNAVPQTIRPIFKQAKIITAKTYANREIKTSVDYFFLPAEKEIFGQRTHSVPVEFNALFQFDYYKVSSNRIKNKEGNSTTWFQRSPYYDRTYFCDVGWNGAVGWAQAMSMQGIAPHGCI